jgi:Aldo/keto reductase family
MVEPDAIAIMITRCLGLAQAERHDAGPAQVDDPLATLAHDLADACVSERAKQLAVEPQTAIEGRDNEVAAGVGRTPAQVLLRWCVQRDLIVLPKSTHRDRIEENAGIFDFTLSDADMAALDALDETGGTDRARERRRWRPLGRPGPMRDCDAAGGFEPPARGSRCSRPGRVRFS